jgi:hypothetical protein
MDWRAYHQQKEALRAVGYVKDGLAMCLEEVRATADYTTGYLSATEQDILLGYSREEYPLAIAMGAGTSAVRHAMRLLLEAS